MDSKVDIAFQNLKAGLDLLAKEYEALAGILRTEKTLLLSTEIDKLNENNKIKEALLFKIRGLCGRLLRDGGEAQRAGLAAGAVRSDGGDARDLPVAAEPDPADRAGAGADARGDAVRPPHARCRVERLNAGGEP